MMASLFFLVVTTVGILKPTRNAFALEGLADSEFYKVYMISAIVILFVVPYNRLADRIPWRLLIPIVSLFFAASFLVFRVLYREGSTAFGVIFYGWYDLYAAVMVTQFFMATQLCFDAREAKRLYPFAIAGGSIGAVFGAAITGFFVERLGAPNMLLVAAFFVVAFAAALPYVLAAQAGAMCRPEVRRREQYSLGEFLTIFRNKHVLLIAGAVLLTVLVKQLVDYQFNEIVGETYETRDAIGAFQGKFFAATQWLPLVVLAALRPILHRWGVGLVVLMLPVVLLTANVALAVTWSLMAAVMAKAGDSSFRYSAERAGREILYVPLPDSIKLKAKAYIDMAVEKGLGKALSSVLIFASILVVDYRKVGYVAVALGVIWVAAAIAVRREYVKSLARSIRGRFASFEGIFASMADASTIPAVQQALVSGDERGIAFALDLVEQADPASARPLVEDLHGLLANASPRIRERALDALTDFPEEVDWRRVRELTADADERVRVAAVRLLCSAGADPENVIKSLLDADERSVRVAALSCLGEEGAWVEWPAVVAPEYFERLQSEAQRDGVEARVELALALVAMGDDSRVRDALGPLLRDPEPEVAAAALRTAGRLGRREYLPSLISALGSAATREAAREALLMQGEQVEGTLADYLEDSSVEPAVRRHIPAVLARIPAQATVDDMLRIVVAAPSDRLLHYRALKALNKLRTRGPGLAFSVEAVGQVLHREMASGARYAEAASALAGLGLTGPAAELLQRSLSEAWLSNRERVFRTLGLWYPPHGVYRSYIAIEGGGTVARANALEWLEQTVGHGLFQRLLPAVQEGVAKSRHREARDVLTELMADDDVWLASCALWAASELGEPWVGEALQRARESANAELRDLAERALARMDEKATQPELSEMNLIEKVFLLQQVDLLSDAHAEDLALLASVAEEISVTPGTVLIRQGEPTEAMYVVIRGAVELRRANEDVYMAEEGTAFGTWALIDGSASLMEARVAEASELLILTREDFYDLLADHAELARGLLTGLARRLRNLVA
jgi:ATP/ADP translocase/HEAT repeat protein